ncbi:alkaline phosphatase family protein, partial [Pseudomonas sp. CCC3.1]|nr:alkaline phosphatase family protein [Pseudomonas sp. CCC3.1]
NWPANRRNGDDTLYRNSIHAYEIFQCSHGPAHVLLANGRINRRPKNYWYTFADGDRVLFVMDCRTERVLTGSDTRMIGVA